MIASAGVNSTFKKYSKQICKMGVTGAEAARRVLLANGVTDVRIARTAGSLTDH
ncbi:MAG: zinc metallopeptidase, partial [Clostridia bacterium]|nr:zinc metallopeptidase [Clostridia bacterium]